MTDVDSAGNYEAIAKKQKLANQLDVESFDGIDAADLQQRLKLFYARLFPFELMFEWLSYGDPKNFLHRELSYTLSIRGDEIYARYKSYPSVEKFKQAIVSETPIKIDIGAIYPCAPADRSSVPTFAPQQRELVFDIDLTDYDDTRYCCQGAAICEKCFGLMRTAIQITDERLREDFGFQHLLWVFSGRRGVHCWISDKTARTLEEYGRSSIVDFLTLVTGGDQMSRKVQLPRGRLHPTVQAALTVCTPFFERYIEEQDIFSHEDRFKKVLDMLPFDDLRHSLYAQWTSSECQSNSARWEELKAAIRGTLSKPGKFTGNHPIEEIILAYTYPRFDANVTRGMNHLLKSPFCVHPKTQNLCSIIDPAQLDQFRLDTVPSLPQMLKDLNRPVADTDDDLEGPEYLRTHMKSSIESFEKFLRGLKRERQRELGSLQNQSTDIENLA